MNPKAYLKEHALTVAAQVGNEKANKAREREQEKTSNAITVTATNYNNQSQKDELRRGLEEGLMYKKLQKVIHELHWKQKSLPNYF